MKHHIVVYNAYYYAELIAPNHYRTREGDLFITPFNSYVHTFPTRIEAYRWMYFNVPNLTKWWKRRRICYSYEKLTRILRKLYIEDFI